MLPGNLLPSVEEIPTVLQIFVVNSLEQVIYWRKNSRWADGSFCIGWPKFVYEEPSSNKSLQSISNLLFVCCSIVSYDIIVYSIYADPEDCQGLLPTVHRPLRHREGQSISRTAIMDACKNYKQRWYTFRSSVASRSQFWKKATSKLPSDCRAYTLLQQNDTSSADRWNSMCESAR